MALVESFESVDSLHALQWRVVGVDIVGVALFLLSVIIDCCSSLLFVTELAWEERADSHFGFRATGCARASQGVMIDLHEVHQVTSIAVEQVFSP
jgi:Na+-transporting methylmalonyl-CoA/oxaloacetate decarboxylase gamma subunit